LAFPLGKIIVKKEVQRIGVFGGSFDPVHVGHLWIAEAALESLELDEIRWIPTATSPLKPSGAVASDEDRLQMVRLAVSGTDKHRIDDREIRRGEISFSWETLTQIATEQPAAELFLVVGSDSLASFRQWQRPAQVLQLATLAVVQRAGEAAIDFHVLDGLASPAHIARCQQAVIPMPQIELSSSQLRARIASGRRIRFRVPHAVEAYIHAQQLYRDPVAGRGASYR
jgi:nicotinate-nucleotide adenylyltransferase